MTLIKFKNGTGLRNFPMIDRPFGFPSLFSETLDRLWADEDVNWMPSANIKERAGDFKIDLAVPGMNKEDFKIEVENNQLIISGERKDEVMDENDKMTRTEFHYGAFKRTFTLPESTNSEDVTANYKDGMLTLLIAKKDEAKLKAKKQIEVK